MADLADLSQNWGEDLQLSVTGDVAVSITTDRAEERVLRRLLTNPGEYLFALDYGGGVRGYIGQAVEAAKVRSSIRAQLREESAVSQTPPPTIEIQPIVNGVAAQVYFSDSVSQSPVALTLRVDDQ